MGNYTVYMHISPSNKRYIGITSQKEINIRWQNGYGYKHNKYFTNAINKYGWDSFQHIIIARGLDEEEAKWLEIELIREWDSINPNKGYNISFGGDTGNHLKGENHPMYGKNPRDYMSEEAKKEHDRKISEAMKGKQHTKRTRKKISKSKKGSIPWNKGKTNIYSEETRKKISEANKGKNTGKNNPCAKSVICVTTNMIFTTVKEGTEYYNCNNISLCCKGRRKSAGKLSDGTKLVWRFIEIIEL